MHSSIASTALKVPPPPARSTRAFAVGGPLVLLGIEAAILTPQVEFNRGVMRILASPGTFTVAYLSLTLFMVLTSADVRKLAFCDTWRRRFLWLAINVITFCALASFTLKLAAMAPSAVRLRHAGIWLLLVAAVGISGWLSFVPVRALSRWLQSSWHKGVGAIIIAISFVITTPMIQLVWSQQYRPTVMIAERLLAISGHDNTVMTMHGRDPTLKTGRHGTALRITRFCAEMESLATFLLVGTLLMFANWQRIRKTRLLIVVAGGLAILYLLNAIRLACLVDIAGTFAQPDLAVALAHSRLGGVIFLGISVLMLTVSKSWWRCDTTAS